MPTQKPRKQNTYTVGVLTGTRTVFGNLANRTLHHRIVVAVSEEAAKIKAAEAALFYRKVKDTEGLDFVVDLSIATLVTAEVDL